MICCIGDLHLGALDRTIPGAYTKVLSTLDRVVENVKKKGCEHIVLLGDIFDKPTADDDMMIAFWALVMKHKDMKWHSIVGNHDMANVNEYSLKLTKWLGDVGAFNITTYAKPKVVKINGDKYLFCPHPYVIDAPDSVRYCFGHFGWNGAKSDTGHSLKTRHEPKGRWVLGDYHTAQRGKRYQYAGGLCQVKFYEGQDKGYIELDDEDRFVAWEPDIKLGKAVIRNPDDMAALDKDIYWQVKITAKAGLPADWAQRYPHVVDHSADKIASDRAKILMKKVATEDPLKELPAFLRNCGLSDKEIALADKILGRQHVSS